MADSGIRSRRFARPIEFDPPALTKPIGVVVPFDFSLDWEYWSYLPDDVALHFTRTPHLRHEVGTSLARGVGRPGVVAKATRALSSIEPAAVLYACSSGSFVDGVAGEARIVSAMLEAGAPAAVTTAGATVDALRVTGMRTVSVVSAHHLGVNRHISLISKSTIADLVREADDTDADAVVVSCTALRTWGMVSHLEGELGRPVFTSNQVSLWAVLRAAGVLGGRVGLPGPGWTMGGSDPARSTELLLQADEAAGAA